MQSNDYQYLVEEIIDIYNLQEFGFYYDDYGYRWDIDIEYSTDILTMTYHNEPHIFWHDVYCDLVNGSFESKNLSILILNVKETDEQTITIISDKKPLTSEEAWIDKLVPSFTGSKSKLVEK